MIDAIFGRKGYYGDQALCDCRGTDSNNDDDGYHAKQDSDETDHHPNGQKGFVHVDLQGLVLPTLQDHHADHEKVYEKSLKSMRKVLSTLPCEIIRVIMIGV